MTRLVHCLCEFAASLSEDERTEYLGTSLQLLYNSLPEEDSRDATLILDTLGVTNNNNNIFLGTQTAISEENS